MAPIAANHPELEVVTDERVIEAANYFEGSNFGRYNEKLLIPKNLWQLRNPLKPSWGEPYTSIVARVRLNPALAPDDSLKGVSGWARWKPFLQYVLPLTAIFGMVVGSMIAGWATPTESAAIGSIATLAIAVCYRALTPRRLFAALQGTLVISAMILFIILGATTFSQILSFSGATNGLVQAIVGSGLSARTIVVGMLAMLIFLGLFIEQISTMMITLPVFMPIFNQLGLDPVWFGVMYLICMQLGLLLPPHGMLLMTMRGVAPPEVGTGQIFRAVTPYVLMTILLLVAVFFVPGIASWLPGLIA